MNVTYYGLINFNNVISYLSTVAWLSKSQMTPTSEIVKKSSASSPKWPFLYSVDIQTSFMYLLTVYVSLLAPFPDSSQENEHLNFIHDFLYNQLDRVQVTLLLKTICLFVLK